LNHADKSSPLSPLEASSDAEAVNGSATLEPGGGMLSVLGLFTDD